MAARFWVGGTGTWDASDTTHWAATSGGAGGQSVPGSADTVTFDGSSGGGTMTCGAAYAPSVVSITFGAFTGTLDFATNSNSVTVQTISGSGAGARTFKHGSGTWNVTGNAATIIDFTTITNLTYSDKGTFICNYSGSTGTRTLSSGIQAIASLPSISISAGSDGVTLSTTFRVQNLNFTGYSGICNNGNVTIYGDLTLSSGMSFNLSGNTHTFSGTSGIQTVTTNGCIVNRPLSFTSAGAIVRFADNLTSSIPATSGTALAITSNANQAVDFTTNAVTVTLTGLTPAITGRFTGVNAFYNLVITGTAVQTGNLSLVADIECTNNITITGNSKTNRLLVQSSVIGARRIITAAGMGTNHGSGVDFQDIEGAGAASWDMSSVTNYSGDCGGNKMKALGTAAFTTAATQTATGTSSFTWSTHGWTSRVPLPQDDVSIPNAFSATQTVTQDMPRIGRNIIFSCTGSPTFTTSLNVTIFGSIDLTGVGTFTANGNNCFFYGRGAHTLKSPIAFDFPINIVSCGGSYTLAGNFTVGATRFFQVLAGTFDTGAYSLSTGIFQVSNSLPYPVAVKLNAGTHYIVSTGSVLTLPAPSPSCVIDAGTSTIQFTNTANTSITVSSAAKLYNIWFNRGTSNAIINFTASGIYNDFKDTGTVAHTLSFGSGTATGVGTFTVVGNAGQLITIQGNSAGAYAAILCKSGTINCNYITSKDLLVGGGATWNAGANSTFSTGNVFGSTFGWADAPDTVRSRYLVATGNYSSTGSWSTTSGGSSGATVPVGEIVKLDANSGTNVLTIDATSKCGEVDCTGFTGTLAGSSNFENKGNIKLVSGMTFTYSGTLTMAFSGTAKSLDFGGLRFTALTTDLQGVDQKSVNLFGDNGFTDSWAASSNLTFTGTLTLTSGTFDGNGYSITVPTVALSGSVNRTMKLGNGDWYLTGTGAVWAFSPGSSCANLIAGTSTIYVNNPAQTSTAKTFYAGKFNYHNLYFTGNSSGECVIASDNAYFNEIKVVPGPESTKRLSFGSSTNTGGIVRFKTLTATGDGMGKPIQIGSAGATNLMTYLVPDSGWASIDYAIVSNLYVYGTLFCGANSIANGTSGQAPGNYGVVMTAPTTRISGTVTNGATPVSGATVRLFRTADNTPAGLTTTDGSGAYSFYADPAQTYHAFIEYTDGGTKYNAKSLWNLTPA